MTRKLTKKKWRVKNGRPSRLGESTTQFRPRTQSEPGTRWQHLLRPPGLAVFTPLSASDRLLPAVRRISDPETSFDRGRTLCVNRPGQAIRFHSGSKSAIRPVLTPELTPDGCERRLPHPPHEHTFGFVAVSHSSSHFRLNFVVRLVNFVSVSC